MALSDPFDTTYAGAYKSGLSLGQGIDSAAGDVAAQMKLQQQRKMATDMLTKFGMLQSKTEDPTLDDLTNNAKDFVAKTMGPGHELNINAGDNPEEAKQNLMGIYKALNIPMPQGKTTTTLNLTPGTQYDPNKGEVSFIGQKKEKTLPEQIAEYSTAQKMLDTAGLSDNTSVKTGKSGISLSENNGTTRDDKLEKQAGDYMNKIVQSRSGGLGLQDSKVNQAIDLRKLVDGSKDPVTGEYKIPPAFQTELVLGLARMISPTGQVGVELEKELATKTAQEGLAKMAIYFGADPAKVGGAPQNVIKYYLDAIDRQGSTAEKLRDNYVSGIKQRAEFKGLSEDAKKRILDSNMGSSFNQYLKNGDSNAPSNNPVQSQGQSVGKYSLVQ